MVKFTNFEEFYTRSKELFLAKPLQTRYTMKIRPGDQRINYKVTDDVVVYQFWTESQTVAKEADRMNTMMILLMSMPEVNAESAATLLETVENVEKKKPAAEKKKHNKD